MALGAALVTNKECGRVTERGIPIGRVVPIGKHLDERLATIQQAGLAEWSGRKLASMAPVAKVATVRGRRSVAQLRFALHDSLSRGS